jgi:WD40 repeat protein
VKSSRFSGQPKILDFGVARLTNSDLAAITQHTTAGELIGTVPYMSPEQAAGDPSQLDWRSDVYSLGVILYELLTGRLPHDVRRLLVHEAVRAIREDDPTPAGSIVRTLRGDLETILGKALEKDKQRRYQSAADLAADIRRYLSEQPIAARPASAMYRLRKFARRNKAIVSGVAIAFLALAVGTAVSTRQAIIAERARAEEHRLRGEAERQTYRSCLVAASSALRYHDIADARRQLDAAPVGLRGWEWQHLFSRIDDSLAKLLTGFVPMRMALSPDGTKVVSCSSAGNFCIWRVPEFSVYGKSGVHVFVGSRVIERFVYSADGCELRVDTRNGAVRFDAASLELIDFDSLTAPQRDRDGRYGLFGEPQRGNETFLRELAVTRGILHFEQTNIHTTPVRFSDDGQVLAIGFGDERGLHVYRVEDGGLVFDRRDLDRANALAFTADGTRLGVATGSGGYVLDAVDGRTLATLVGDRPSFSRIEFSPDGRRIATTASDRTVRFWRADDGELLSVMHGNQGRLAELAYSPDGATVVTACADKTIRWWDATRQSNPFVFQTPGTVYGLAFSPDGTNLAAACLGGDRPLRIWDLETSRERIAALDGYPSALAYNRDGSRLAVGSAHGDTRVLNAADATVVSGICKHDWRTNSVAFDPAGTHLLTLGNDGRLNLTELAGGGRIRTRRFPEEQTGEGCRAAVSPDASLVVVASRRTIHLLDGETWGDVGKLAGHTGNIYALAFSPDGSRLVSGGADRTLRVWDVRRREPIATLIGHSDEIFAATFSPDGKRIVSGGRDSEIRVWDAEWLDEITQLHGHTSFVYCLAFSPDGRTLASGGGDATVRLWDTRPYRERRPE